MLIVTGAYNKLSVVCIVFIFMKAIKDSKLLSCRMNKSIFWTKYLFHQGESGQFDPQTEADRASQKCIIGSLLKTYPTLQIIGEEEVSKTYNNLLFMLHVDSLMSCN